MARQKWVVLIGFETDGVYHPAGEALDFKALRKEVREFLLAQGAIGPDSGEAAPDSDDTEEEGAEVAGTGNWLSWGRSTEGDAAPDSEEALTEEDDGQDR